MDGQNGLWAKTICPAGTLRDGSAWFAEYWQSHGQWELDQILLFSGCRDLPAGMGQDATVVRSGGGGRRAGFGGAGLCADRLGHAARPAGRADGAGVLAAASHELKSPLAVIITSAELLPSGGEEAKYRANILSEAHRMAQLVQELLSLSRLETAARQDHAGKAGHRGLSLGSLRDMAAGGGKGR